MTEAATVAFGYEIIQVGWTLAAHARKIWSGFYSKGQLNR